MKWRIGEWVACSDTDTIRTNTGRTDASQHKLERRAMEALVVLAERAGEVVKKDELIAAVWGRLAVSDHSVAMVVSQLRRALNDDARAPRYIETITKRGYRLIAPCEAVREVAPPERGVARLHLSDRVPRPFGLLSAVFAVLGVSAISALLLWPA